MTTFKNNHSFKHFSGDLKGGVTAAIIALPLALGFGIASGLGAMAGLYGAIILGFMASLFGGTPTQISGPTGPMTVVMASAYSAFSGHLSLVMAVVLTAGLIQILLGVLRVGRFMKFIPQPVISGFMTGIGIIIILLQINPLLGADSAHSILQALQELPQACRQMNPYAVGVTLATVLIMFFTPGKLARIIPPAIIAVVSMTALKMAFDWPLKTIGQIPQGLPEWKPPTFPLTHLSQILELGIALAILGMIDTLLTSLVADSLTRQKHQPDKEMIGQGIGNTLCSFVGGLPGAGATMRTVVNIRNGGRTRLSGIIHAIILAMIVFFFAPWAAEIPLPVLAGILIKVGIDIFDYKFLKRAAYMPLFDVIVAVVVLLLTVFVDLIYAVAIGTAIAALLTVYRLTRESGFEFTTRDSTFEHLDADKLLNKKTRILTVKGAFFFGNASLLSHRINEALGINRIIIDCRQAPFMDYSAISALEEAVEQLTQEGAEVIVLLQPRFTRKIRKIDSNGVFRHAKLLDDPREIQRLADQLAQETE